MRSRNSWHSDTFLLPLHSQPGLASPSGYYIHHGCRFSFSIEPTKVSPQTWQCGANSEGDRRAGLIVGIVDCVNRQGVVTQRQCEQVNHLAIGHRCAVQVCPDALQTRRANIFCAKVEGQEVGVQVRGWLR